MKCGECGKQIIISNKYECETCGMKLCSECKKHSSTPTAEKVLCSACARGDKLE